MGLPMAIAMVRRQVDMFLKPATFETVVAFITGYDAAQSFAFLAGFREWLTVRIDRRMNLGWPAIASAIIGERASSKEHMEGMFSLLEEFVNACEERQGRRKIYIN